RTSRRSATTSAGTTRGAAARTASPCRWAWAARTCASRTSSWGGADVATVTADLLERLRGRTDEAEVFRAGSDGLEVRFSNGQVKTAVARETSGLAARAIKGGKLGFAGSRDTSPDGLERLVLHLEHSIDVGD